MMNKLRRVFIPRSASIAALIMLFSLSAWAMNPNEADLNDPNRGTATLDDECGDCTIDYTGLLWPGTGGQGGRGTIHWPGGATGNNYGQMVFNSTCEFANPLHAWCVDLYHPVQTQNYGVDYFAAVITDDSCRMAQLTALAYLMAWNYPTSTFEDDAMQLAIWKLSSIRDGGPNDGLPHFCYDAGRGYPNFGDTPTYPYVNTVYGSNAPRNDWANEKLLDAIGKNVLLPGDTMTGNSLAPVLDGDSATVALKFCIARGPGSVLVNDLWVSNIKLNVSVQVGDNPAEVNTYFTDANGCIEISVTQPTLNPDSVYVNLCTKSSWAIGLVGCEESTFYNNQWLVWALEPIDTCFNFGFPGDEWLSVELSGFDAYTTSDGVDLQWSTASEANADHWEIERCVSGQGQFELIAQIPAQNNATGATYTFADRIGLNGTTYDYRLVDIDLNGVRTVHPNSVTVLYGSHPSGVSEYSLADAYPNPFNPTTTISFSIPEAAAVKLHIYDLTGRVVAELVNGVVEAGAHSIEWNAQAMPSGTYFYSLTAANYTATKKLLLLK